MLPSFTGTGACLNNAYIESFFATLKKELVYQSTFATREEARLAVFEFIEGYYNRWRLHSSLGYRSPTESKPCKGWQRKLNFQCLLDPSQLQTD